MGKAQQKVPYQSHYACKIKLDMLDAAQEKHDLRIPPANHLEELKGNLAGYMSIRINNQFRVVFRFDGIDAYEVHITDYH